MAIRYIVADDLDGATTGVDTYQFSVDGVDYQIDLTDDNHQRLLAALAPFTAVARRAPKNGKAQARRGNATKPRGATSADVRAWWSQHWQSHSLPEPRSHGIVPAQVRKATTPPRPPAQTDQTAARPPLAGPRVQGRPCR